MLIRFTFFAASDWGVTAAVALMLQVTGCGTKIPAHGTVVNLARTMRCADLGPAVADARPVLLMDVDETWTRKMARGLRRRSWMKPATR